MSPPAEVQPTVLIVGDSLVAAAAADLTGYTPPGVRTVVVAGVGASPCDLWASYRAQRVFGGKYLSFKAAVQSDQPKVIVLAFTGNPGVSANACIKRSTAPYSLSAIVSRYRRSLNAMGSFAEATGVKVILSATPARNPSVSEGWVDGSEHGFNGDAAFNVMMSLLARDRSWTYDTGSAAAISGPGLGWTLYLPCQAAAGVDCIDGHQRVRYGGPDAIHCDAPGTNGSGAPSDGSLRFAHGLLVAPLAFLGRRPLDQVRSPSPAKACSS